MAASVWSGYLTFGLDLHAGTSFLRRAQFAAFPSTCCIATTCRGSSSNIICPPTSSVVERSEIVKGYEYRKDEYVVIEPDEIKKIEPKTAKTMEILEFVKTERSRSRVLRVVVLHAAGRGRTRGRTRC